MAIPSRVRIFEVGARDGLQNEKQMVPSDIKVELIERLVDAGVTSIETGSFVSPKWVPQMADTAEVMSKISRRDDVTYAVLTPNMKGYEGAVTWKADEIEIFSAALGSPFDGEEITPAAVADVAKKLYDMEAYEISLGDTIGVGTPLRTKAVIEAVAKVIPLEAVGVHFHDTYGQALANYLAALEMGVSRLDSSVAGLGGCPYAPGATGNVATEDVVYMLDGMGIDSGIDLKKLVRTAWFISDYLGRPPVSSVARALKGKLD